MKLRPLLAVTATVAAATAGTALVPSAAQAAPPGATNVVSYPDLPDLPAAPGAVDITKVSLYRTAGAYRASVSYAALRKQKGNRWYVSFAPVLSLPSLPVLGRGTGAAEPSGILPTLATTGNIVELRRTPGGKIKSLSYKYTADGVAKATCHGVRATPSWSKSKIVFTVPNACFKAAGGLLPLVQVDAGARHYAPGTFDGTAVPADTSVSGKSDSLLLPDPWFVGDSPLPTS